MMNRMHRAGKEEDHQRVVNNSLEVGLDEVGKGAIFGPVLAAAVVLTNRSSILLKSIGVNDSKKLSPQKRQSLFPEILKLSTDWGIGQSSVGEIDKLGIRSATEIAMIRAIQKLNLKPEKIYVDGPLPLRLWNKSQENIIKGDTKIISIAASSILAKVTRDSIINNLSDKYSGYYLSKNKGYGTKEHFSSINKKGLTLLHRDSFLKRLNVTG